MGHRLLLPLPTAPRPPQPPLPLCTFLPADMLRTGHASLRSRARRLHRPPAGCAARNARRSPGARRQAAADGLWHQPLGLHARCAQWPFPAGIVECGRWPARCVHAHPAAGRRVTYPCGCSPAQLSTVLLTATRPPDHPIIPISLAPNTREFTQGRCRLAIIRPHPLLLRSSSTPLPRPSAASPRSPPACTPTWPAGCRVL